MVALTSEVPPFARVYYRPMALELSGLNQRLTRSGAYFFPERLQIRLLQDLLFEVVRLAGLPCFGKALAQPFSRLVQPPKLACVTREVEEDLLRIIQGAVSGGPE